MLEDLAAEIKGLSHQVSKLQEEREYPWWKLPVLTSDQAREYLGIRSPSTFYDRMAAWGVSQCAPGLWPRRKIDGAMEKIARGKFRSNAGRKSRNPQTNEFKSAV